MSKTLDLDEIRARVATATPLPWENLFRAVRVPDRDGSSSFDIFVGDEADADFISHAREDVPALLCVIEQIRDLIDRFNREQHVGRGALVTLADIATIVRGQAINA
jgi:hypothetical protein